MDFFYCFDSKFYFSDMKLQLALAKIPKVAIPKAKIS